MRKVIFYIHFYFYIFFFIFINNQGIQRKMLKELNAHFFSYLVKTQLYHMNGVRVLTMSNLQGIALQVLTKFGVRFIVAGACQSTQANFSQLPNCYCQIVCGSYLGV